MKCGGDISAMMCEKDCVFTPAVCFENWFVHILLTHLIPAED